MTKNPYQFWGGKIIQKRYVKKVIEFDFKKLIEKVENGHKMMGGTKKLISPSSVLKNINDYKFFGIPKDILENRRQDGSVLMEYLEKVFIQKQLNINDFPITSKQKKDLFNLFNWFVNNGVKLLAVEKPITNGTMYGIIDCVIKKDNKYFVLEIKLRNNLKIENSDRFQAKCYSHMMEIPAMILVLSDNGDVVTETLLKADFKQEMKQVQQFYKLFGVELDWTQKIKIGD